MARTVRAPDGRTWRVRRQWVNHRVRWRGRVRPREGVELGLDAFDAVDVADAMGSLLVPIAIGLAIIAVLLTLVVLGLPLVVLVLEALFFVVVVAAGIVGRVVLRRPWTIVAEEVATSRTDRGVRTWKVVGWRASGRAVEDVARHLEAGVEPMPAAS